MRSQHAGQAATAHAIRVLVVDDHPFVRAGLTSLFGLADGFQVVGECDDGADVLAAAETVQPDVVLMDQRMPRMSGPEATRRLLAAMPWVRVLMLTGALTGTTLAEASKSGAAGFLLKGGNVEVLLDAVRTVAAGGTAWPSGDELAG